MITCHYCVWILSLPAEPGWHPQTSLCDKCGTEMVLFYGDGSW